MSVLGKALGTIVTGHNMFIQHDYSGYVAPIVTVEIRDCKGYPVLTVQASHSEHVARMLSGTTYPGAVYRKITRTGWHEYRVEVKPFDTEICEATK